jgi:catechol 2,3-dioxygenase-like lactoylglutathione lyase family enzyme
LKFVLKSILVDDQEDALQFYTLMLGFQKKADVPMRRHRWLTIVAGDDPNEVELVREPDEHPAAKPFKQALVEDGIPFTSFVVENVQAEYDRLSQAGVEFTRPPVAMGR